MPPVVWEEKGRSFTLGEGRPSNRLRYFVTGAYTEIETVNAIAAVLPNPYNGLWFLNTEAEEEGYGYWRGTANYGIPTGGTGVPSQLGGSPPPPPPPPAPNDALGPEWSFDTSGGTKHITTSIETVQAEKGLGFGTAPDTKRAIGIDKDGVKGCDIVSPKFEFSVTRKMKALSLSYLKTLIDLTACVNEDEFLGIFPQGEILFLGASGSYRDNEGWSVVYRFSGSPNKEAVNENGSSPLDRIAPRGHDHVWCTYEDEESEGFKISVPSAAFVEQVYFYGDFDLLGI